MQSISSLEEDRSLAEGVYTALVGYSFDEPWTLCLRRLGSTHASLLKTTHWYQDIRSLTVYAVPVRFSEGIDEDSSGNKSWLFG